ncbi:MAG TPA: capsular biosynthesis protein [Steroidobacter sp.]|uniref:capsular biosynthesis protein n=1 Tax=Steroidobacter sp. TaxID=1978227 RepID=UPI002ED933E4
MIRRERCIVIDVDGTLCHKKRPDQAYDEVAPAPDVVATLREYRARGFYVILATSRNMNTYSGNIGLINANTLKLLFAWLDRHEIPYDEVHVGKPWAGKGGFYVDDKAIRPDEFTRLSYQQICQLVGEDQS